MILAFPLRVKPSGRFAALYDAKEVLVAHVYGPESEEKASFLAQAAELAEGFDAEDFRAFRRMRDGLNPDTTKEPS